MTTRHWYRVLFYSLIPAFVLLAQVVVAGDASGAIGFFIALIILYLIVAPIVAFILMRIHGNQVS